MEARVIIGKPYDPTFGFSTGTGLYYVVGVVSIPYAANGEWHSQTVNSQNGNLPTYISSSAYACIPATGTTGSYAGVTGSPMVLVPPFAVNSVLLWN